jgi:hypothetical protein
MKQVCAASPGKFASALLDILDGSIEDSPAYGESPVTQKGHKSPCKPDTPKTSMKRPASAALDETPAKKKSKLSKDGAASQTCNDEVPAKSAKKVKEMEKNVIAQRRKELRAMKNVRIKEMATRKGLGVESKDKMIESIIALEVKSRENIRKHKSVFRDVVCQKREEFGKKTNKELKELLQAYALQMGGTKPERVDRLLATWKQQGEIEKVLAGKAFQARKIELSGMDKVALYELCRKKRR